MGAQLRKLTQCVSSTGHQHADNDETASESDEISPLIEDAEENARDDVTQKSVHASINSTRGVHKRRKFSGLSSKEGDSGKKVLEEEESRGILDESEQEPADEVSFHSEQDEEETLSLLEQLPRDLVWAIVECAQWKAVLNMRQASWQLKSHVDDYATLRMPIPLVCLSGDRTVEGKGVMVNITINIPAHKWTLFLLRLQLREVPKLQERMHKLPPIKNFLTPEGNPEVEFNLHKGDGDLLEYLNECIRGRVAKVVLTNCTGKKSLKAVTALLEGTTINLLEVNIETLTEQVRTHTLTIIKARQIQQLALFVAKCSTPGHSAESLLDLASVLRTLFIKQSRGELIHKSSDYLLGVHKADWASTILRMFSKRLDKLCISNDYIGFLSRKCADALIEMIPTLKKEVWLSVTCNKYPEGLSKHNFHNYSVRAENFPDTLSVLKIVHNSREYEQLWSYGN